MNDGTKDNTDAEYLYHWVIGVAFPGEHEYKESDLLAALAIIHEQDELILPSLIEHLQKGTPTAHHAVMSVFEPLVRLMIQWATENDDDAYGPIGDTYPMHFRMAWNVGNVMEEAGIPREEVDNIAYSPIVIGYGDDATDDLVAEDWLYRGRAALAATEMWTHEGDVDMCMDFIEYAGKHWDIGTVIRTATERRTTNVEALTALIDHTGVHAPILRGVL